LTTPEWRASPWSRSAVVVSLAVSDTGRVHGKGIVVNALRRVGEAADVPRAPRTLLALLVVFMVLAAAALVLLGTFVWTGNPLLRRLLCAVLAVMLIGVAAKKYLLDAARSRRPRWQRFSALLVLFWAAYMVVLAIRGV
jgi:hypothetical protein